MFLMVHCWKVGKIVEITEFSLTNEIFFYLCKLKNDRFHNITWNEICAFLSVKLQLGEIPKDNLVQRLFDRMQTKISEYSHCNKHDKKLLFFKQQLKFENCVEEESVSDVDIGSCSSNADTELVRANQTIIELKKSFCQLKRAYSQLEVDNLGYELDHRKEQQKINSLECQFEKQKMEYERICKEMKEKCIITSAKFNIRNANKREKRKAERIQQLQNDKCELDAVVAELQKEVKLSKEKYEKERKRVFYNKNKNIKADESTNSLSSNLAYYENLSMELQEKVDELLSSNVVQTFMNGKYVDDVRTVYYELLRRNVSVQSCGDIIKLVLTKLGKKSVDKLPKKKFSCYHDG